MSKEIAEYFDSCIEGIIKVIFLPIGIIAIILKHLVKGGDIEWVKQIRCLKN